jgi:hypothetical protein
VKLASSAWAVALVVLLVAPRVEAAGDPDLDWWTIETAHFRIHYEKNLEPVAEKVARLGEDIHARLIGPLGWVPAEITELVLTDVTDDANGSASTTPYNAVRMFVTAPSDLSPLADYDDWYLSLLTHEYTHILHVDNHSGLPILVNAIFGKTFVPNQIQPRWIIEGLAVVSESAYTSGGRIRASLFDMYVRTDVLGDNIPGLDQLSSNARRWPQGTIFYLWGSRFLQFIVDVYGPDVLRAVATDYGQWAVPWGINRSIRRQTGRTYVELYDGFKAELRRRYARQMRQVERRGLREGKQVTFHGRTVSYPAFVPRHARETDAQQIVYYRDDQHERSGHYRFDVDLAREEPPDEELVARSIESSPVGFSPEGDMLFSSVVPYERIYRFTDLFTIPRGETAPRGTEAHRRRLTVGLRATAPSVDRIGRQVAFTRNHRGTTTLMVADRDDEGVLSNVRPLVPSPRFDQAYTPAFSPDGSRLVYSAWRAGGFRDLRLVDLSSGAVEQLTNDRALDQNPTWSADGRKIYFTSDRTGIFNVYELDVGSRELRQVTNVRTGALMPTVSEDGKLLCYVGYTTEGYDLYVMPLDESRFLEALPSSIERPDPPAEPPPVPFQKHPYSPWPTVRPYNWFFEVAQGNFGSTALTITSSGGDVVGHHGWAASVVADPEAPGPTFSLDYFYLRLPVDLSVRLANTYVPRSDYRFNDLRPVYVENGLSVRNAVSYADPQEFGTHRIGVSHTASLLRSDLPIAEVGPPDPYAQPGTDPFEGLFSVVHLGYSFSNAEGSFDTPGPARGWSLELGADFADEVIGSQESLYSFEGRVSAYVPMPWRGKHVLALRSAGGMSKGTFSRRGTFFIGGFNLENTTVVDILTSSAFHGAFAVRGYEPGAFRGSSFMLHQAEYRVPIAEPDHGISTLPFYLRRIDGNLFVDYGGAFDDLDYEEVGFFENGAILEVPELHTAVGGELWLGVTLFYQLDLQLRLGYAYGFSEEAIPGGQLYFLSSAAF